MGQATLMNKSVEKKRELLGELEPVIYLKELFQPLTIQFQDQEFDLRDALRLLTVFARELMPEGRNMHAIRGRPETAFAIPKRIKPKRFTDRFPVDYAVAFDWDQLIKDCAAYFKWNNADAARILDFITTDLLSPDSKVQLPDRPLLRAGNQVFWLSTFLRDRAWGVTLLQRFAQEHLNTHTGKSAEQLEQQLADLFAEAGFEAMYHLPYKYGDQESDMDVLAWQDGHLFLIELKTTYVNEDLTRTSTFMAQRLNEKATDQLDLATKLILDCWADADNPYISELKELLQIPPSAPKPKIYPLIVTNIFGSDDYVAGARYSILSLLELKIILTNTLRDLLVVSSAFSKASLPKGAPGIEMPVDVFESMHNQNAESFTDSRIDTSRDTTNLWTFRDRCSAADLISAIEEDKVWAWMDKLWKFDDDRKPFAVFGPEP